jgi:hypothetical protein
MSSVLAADVCAEEATGAIAKARVTMTSFTMHTPRKAGVPLRARHESAPAS